jgi:putative selenium metabolism protein SsnA
MPYLIKSATLVSLDPQKIETVDLRIEDSRVVERAARVESQAGDEVIDLTGRLVMPGLVCAHTHLYSSLARGMPAPPRSPGNFREILELIWWRLDRALDEETIYWSAVAGALDAARSGATCLFDHHASPAHIRGALGIVRKAIEQVGLRAVLCYEVTDRGGNEERDSGLAENAAFIESSASSEMFRGLVGAHASFTLSDASLAACAEIMQQTGAGLHIHVAEDKCDVEDARSNYGMGVVERLSKHAALNDRTILAHGTHLDARELEIAFAAGAWIAHNPRSNMNNQVGYAPVAKFGDRVVLGTDGIGADLFAETRAAFFKGRDSHSSLSAENWLSVLRNNQRMATKAFGVELGELNAGSAADLVILNYDSPTPLTAANLAWHLVFGFGASQIDSVMAAGRFIIRNNRWSIDAGAMYERARAASEKLWQKLRA